MLDSAAYDAAGFSHMTYYIIIIIVLANSNRGIPPQQGGLELIN